MYESLECIALRRVAYSDSKAILSAWSKQRGRVSLLMPEGKGRETARRRALTQPLSFFSIVADIRPGRDIHPGRDVAPLPDSPGGAQGPASLTLIRFFLAEFLDRVLRQTEGDKPLSDFLFSSLSHISKRMTPNAAANFHLLFLSRLTSFLGIGPNTYFPTEIRRSSTLVFDLRDACFRRTPPLHDNYVEGDAARAVRILTLLDCSNSGIAKFSRIERAKILDGIIRYYKIHLTDSLTLNSLDILREL